MLNNYCLRRTFRTTMILSQILAKVVTGTRNPTEAKQLYWGEEEEEREEEEGNVVVITVTSSGSLPPDSWPSSDATAAVERYSSCMLITCLLWVHDWTSVRSEEYGLWDYYACLLSPLQRQEQCGNLACLSFWVTYVTLWSQCSIDPCKRRTGSGCGIN